MASGLSQPIVIFQQVANWIHLTAVYVTALFILTSFVPAVKEWIEKMQKIFEFEKEKLF